MYVDVILNDYELNKNDGRCDEIRGVYVNNLRRS